MMGVIFFVGTVGSIMLIIWLLVGDWASVYKGIGFVLLMFAIGAVAVGIVLGIIALWAYISMALTGNLP